MRIAQFRWRPFLAALTSSGVLAVVTPMVGARWGAVLGIAAVLVQSQLKRVVERQPRFPPQRRVDDPRRPRLPHGA